MARQDFKNCSFESIQRQKVERAIARRVIADLIAAGYALSVDNGADGDEGNVRDYETLSRDPVKVFDRMFQTDEDYIFVWEAKGAKAHYAAAHSGKEEKGKVGWVRFIYGNSGWDVINDHTTNLSNVLGDHGFDKPYTGVSKMIEQLEAGEFEIVMTPGRAD